MKWNATTNLLTLIVFFDQTLSGFYESAFKFTRDEQLLCSAGTHVAGSLIHATGIAVWTFFLVVHYFRYHSEDQYKGLFITTLGLMWGFFVVYILADVPWPWECFDAMKNMKKGGLISRFVLLILSSILIIIIITICCFVWCWYSCVQKQKFDGRKKSEHSIEKIICGLPSCPPTTVKNVGELSAYLDLDSKDVTSLAYKIVLDITQYSEPTDNQSDGQSENQVVRRQHPAAVRIEPPGQVDIPTNSIVISQNSPVPRFFRQQ
jgi:hypothetical protein